MREGRTGNRGPLMLDLTSAVGRVHLAAVGLLESVRTGRPAYPLVHGRGFWEDLSANAEVGAGFDAVMGSGADPGAVVGLYEWTRVGHVVDVGGGTGRCWPLSYAPIPRCAAPSSSCPARPSWRGRSSRKAGGESGHYRSSRRWPGRLVCRCSA